MKLEYIYKLVLNPEIKLFKKLLLLNYLKKRHIMIQKLKLGSISFDLNTISISGFTISESLEMRFTKQDSSLDYTVQLKSRLDALLWKWDFSNIISLIIITFLFLSFLYSFAFFNLTDLLNLVESDKNNYILYSNSIKNLFNSNLPSSIVFFNKSNYFTSEIIISLFDYYKWGGVTS